VSDRLEIDADSTIRKIRGMREREREGMIEGMRKREKEREREGKREREIERE
jgi:hypothetical protein